MTTKSGKTPNAKKILREFMASPVMERMLGNARQIGPIKGFPLRTDFAHAPTSFGKRVLIVGEAAGLVNPVTGEGIDYALESGILAADCLAEALASGSITNQLAEQYDGQLRHHFQRLFVFSERLRDWYLHAPILNRLIYVANRRDSLRSLFTNVLLGNADASEATSLKTIAQIIFTA